MDQNYNFPTPVIKTTRRRSSFFGYDSILITSPAYENQKVVYEQYFKKLQKESEDWVDYTHKLNLKFRNFWEKDKNSPDDYTVLSQKRQEYLKNAVDVPTFLDDLDKFCKKVDAYCSEKQWLSQRYEHSIAQIEDTITESEQEKIFLKE